MSKEELIAGLKNAVEKGSSLEEAKQSFINAGYNPGEVEEASSFVGSGVLTQYPQLSAQPQSSLQEKKPRKFRLGIIILILVLVILLALLGVSFFFREKILDFISNLF